MIGPRLADEPAHGLRTVEVRERLLREMSALLVGDGLIVARSFYVQLFERHPRFSRLIAVRGADRRDARLASLLRLVSAQVAGAPGAAQADGNTGPHDAGSADADQRDFLTTLAEVLAGWQSTTPVVLGRAIWLNELAQVGELLQLAATP